MQDQQKTSSGLATRLDVEGGAGAITLELARRYGVLIAWILVIIFFSLVQPDNFPTQRTFQVISSSQAVLVFLTLGLLVPLAAGEFDLSIGGVAGVSLVLTGYLNVKHGWAIGPTIVVALGAGLLIGIVNAIFVVKLGVDSFIVTLGTGTALAGAAVGINNLATSPISHSLVNAMRSEFLGLPLIFFYALLLTIAAWYFFSYTPLGRYLYFVGAGRDVARLAGLSVDRIRASSLIVSALLAAVAGILEAGYLGASEPSIGPSFLLPAYAAVFLGAAVIRPGRFNPWGAFIAVYFLATGIYGLQLLGVDNWVSEVFYGASLVLAVTFSQFAARRQAA